MAAGSGLALADHPADDEINERLVGSDFADAFFAPGKVLGSRAFIISVSAATYIVGRARVALHRAKGGRDAGIRTRDLLHPKQAR